MLNHKEFKCRFARKIMALEEFVEPDPILEGSLESKKNIIKADSGTDILPEGFFDTLRFILDKRENHGFGYHSHIMFRLNGKFKRSGYIITVKNGLPYIEKHGNGGTVFFDFNKYKSAVLKEIEPDDISSCFKGIPSENLLNPGKDAIEFYTSNK